MIAHASPKRVMPVSAQIGFRLPAFATSLGRVLLAALDDRPVDEFLSRIKPSSSRRSTIVDKRELRRAILKARDGRLLRSPIRRPRSVFAHLGAAAGLDGKSHRGVEHRDSQRAHAAKAMHSHFFPRLRAVTDELQRQLI